MPRHIASLLLLAILFSCTNEQHRKNASLGVSKQDTFLPPHITILADLPDSLQPKVTMLDTAPKPRTVIVPTHGSSSYSFKNEKGEVTKINLEPPVKKMLPVLLNAKGEPIKDNARNVFIMGKGGKGNFTNFTSDDGLALDAISCSIMDRLGNLWFGTFGGGVSRYDGKTFTNITVAHGLANNQVLSMAEDKMGNIWFGTFGSGVCRFDGSTFTTFTTKHGLANNTILSIAQDKTGKLWFGTGGGGVSNYDGKNFKTFSTTDGLGNNTVMSIAEDKTGNLWFATIGGGVSRYNPSTAKPFMTYTTEHGLASNVVICICPDRAGNLWFGTYGGGTSRYDGKQFTAFSNMHGLANNQVVNIAEDRSGNLWFCTEGGGVSRFDGRTFTSFSATQGLASNAVKTITEDRLGNLWFGTFGNGVSCYNGDAFTNFSTAQGLANNKVYSIEEDKKGNLWFGTDGGGVSCYDGKAFSTFSNTQGIADNTVYSIAKDRKGSLWLGTHDGIYRYDGNSFMHFATIQGLAHNMVFSIAEDKAGYLWFGTNGGVSCYDGKSFTTFTVVQGLANNDVKDITEDSKGNLWFATNGGGVSRYDGKSFVTFSVAQGLANNNVYSITRDRTGNLWFATEGGLSVVNVTDLEQLDATLTLWQEKPLFKTFTKKDGLPDDFVTQVLQMPGGKMAIGTNQGITLFRPSEGLTTINEIEVYNSGTGYPVKDVNVGQHCMLLDSRGIIWAGTGSAKTALVRFDPAALFSNTKAPTLVIKNVKINQENIFWHDLEKVENWEQALNVDSNVVPSYITEEVTTMGRTLTKGERDSMKNRFGDIEFDSTTRIYPVPQGLILPYRHNNITIEFNAIETGKPELVKYRYMLEGYDNDWSPELKKTSATYGNISEGTYNFKVKAQGANGIWSEQVTYTFKVLAPWYRAWWAYIGYAILFVLSLFLFSKWREHNLRMEKERLERTVEKRTEELVQKNIVVEKQKAEVENEKKRSEALLLNILPEEIANELRSTGTTKAKQYDNVTVLFTDFVNFTQAAEQMSPQQLINELHECFSKFDEITGRYNIEKIKTIGDAYLAVAGLPTADSRHAENMVHAAIEINEYMRGRKEKLGNATFGIRLGLHSGSVTAGVVGVKKFAYDIWGDTVNTAARMEQSSEAGKINISQVTYDLVKDKFTCSYRGEQDAKGKGLLKMYYVG